MLVLFENNEDPSATTLEGGFYSVAGALAGKKVEGHKIDKPNDQAVGTNRLQSMYQDNWDEMPVSYDSDYTGIPALVPGIYTQTITKNSKDAAVFVGGLAVNVAKFAPTFDIAGLITSAYGLLSLVETYFSPDQSMFTRYPLIQQPQGSSIPPPIQYFDFRPRGTNR